ncbi:MAG: 2-oxo acid dehydrogenase subunit E2 [Alphaproteobacteria bacterium]|nr:2-oxo acid dehydrogenase subunit E2 [Alphaproteobacteria bacterium]
MAVISQKTSRIFATPLARRLAKESLIDLAVVNGTGPHGRIIEKDVLSFKAHRPVPHSSPKGRPDPALPLDEQDHSRRYYAVGSFEEVPHQLMRKAIARRLTDSARNIPQFSLDVDCEIDNLMRLREDFNGDAPETSDGQRLWKTSINDYLIKSLALALQRVPEANVTYTPEAMLKHRHSNIGVAVSVPGGLISPIIQFAEKKSVREISDEIKTLARRAKDRALKPEEYEGGVSSVSNLGMYGVKRFNAVINPPQSTILAVGKGEERVIVRDGVPTAAKVMTLTLTCDHRAIDGALGAQLLAEIQHFIEHPASMFA